MKENFAIHDDSLMKDNYLILCKGCIFYIYWLSIDCWNWLC